MKKPKIYVGGQAVIEGVMMRSPQTIATAVRTPSGEITVKKRAYSVHFRTVSDSEETLFAGNRSFGRVPHIRHEEPLLFGTGCR